MRFSLLSLLIDFVSSLCFIIQKLTLNLLVRRVIIVLSNVDCFHPSLAGHELIASGVWNRLVGNADERAVSVPWSTDLTFRCLEAGDRIHTDTLI